MKKLARITLCFVSTFFVSICLANTNNNNLELIIPPEQIAQKVNAIAHQIDKDYRGEPLTVLMVMKGAVCVTADLMRAINTPATLDYIKASSYGNNGTKRGELKLLGLENLNLKGKNVLVVDDIFDSGNTMTAIVKQLKKQQPKSLKTLVAFVKNIPRKTTYRPDYKMFDIEDRFIVGYGLDYKEQYRGLPGIYVIKNPS